MIDLSALTARIHATPPACGDVRVVAVDGGAASGKTTFATALALAFDAAQVLHCDDLIDGWVGQFAFWPRLQAGLGSLAHGHIAHYSRYDWTAGEFRDEITVVPRGVLIVEGVSAIAATAPWACMTVYLDVAREVRERRWADREGSALQPLWLAWLDAEDRFFAGHPPRADLIVRDDPG